MKRSIGSLVAGIFVVQLLPGGAWAAGCATQADTAALRIAALQQELMVAAFSCRDVGRYNDFVLAHRPELVASDANLKAFFVRHDASRGEAAYHTYKTELANSASLNSLRDDGFCDRAANEFDASSDRGDLASFVFVRQWQAANAYPVCPGVATPDLQTASVAPPRRSHRQQRNDDDAYATARDTDGRGDDAYMQGRDRDDPHAAGWSRDADDDHAIRAPRPHHPMDGDDDDR